MKIHGIRGTTPKPNASKLHARVGVLLEKLYGTVFTIFQEVPVKDLDPSWPDMRAKFDWVVLTSRVVIECHGEQHYKPAAFSTERCGSTALVKQKCQDNNKQLAAENAGYSYVVVDDDVSDRDAMARIIRAQRRSRTRARDNIDVTLHEKYGDSDKERAQEWRKRMKEQMGLNDQEVKERERKMRRDFQKKLRDQFREQQRSG